MWRKPVIVILMIFFSFIGIAAITDVVITISKKDSEISAEKYIELRRDMLVGTAEGWFMPPASERIICKYMEDEKITKSEYKQIRKEEAKIWLLCK